MVTLTHDSRDTKWAGTVQFEKFEFKKKAGDRFCVFERTKEESNWQLNPKKKNLNVAIFLHAHTDDKLSR